MGDIGTHWIGDNEKQRVSIMENSNKPNSWQDKDFDPCLDDTETPERD